MWLEGAIYIGLPRPKPHLQPLLRCSTRIDAQIDKDQPCSWDPAKLSAFKLQRMTNAFSRTNSRRKRKITVSRIPREAWRFTIAYPELGRSTFISMWSASGSR
ncbi:uncharacterized protein CIMG_05481 [Coccidioides immitis RS]|uniref:Uncharacterized protein n=3 Tax=Coccidioides immitis TaxID=5501 RepID=A0A0E1S3X1_COCIM|nr:uncharacterized protein CIMG_05481 [Coccidioides immitis RS]EAS34457.1 hypothetical protein CIMG_05481 [Coccidioides immitis RS]KMP05608.1 hypothetical protein CIRG_05289 [Coccidioides immitis RMSCC 2394]KMU91176.1 hypothetical protein CIHG_08925 [Coccidioides immitis H538.4]